MPPPVFVSAIAAPDAGPDIAAQMAMTLARLDERLRTQHSSLADAVAITVYLRSAADFAAMNDTYRQAWRGLPPTRTTLVAPLVTKDALVEVSAVAAAAGSERRLVHPPGWSTSPNPYSYALRSGDTLFLSGLIARNGRDNSVVAGDITVQTKAVLDNARELLDAAGLSLEHVVSARVFLTDLADFAAMNLVYREAFASAPPARATVGAALTGPAYKVEMTFVASAGARRVIAGEGTPNPNLSAAIVAGDTAYLSGLLADAPVAASVDAAAQAQSVVRRIDGLLGGCGLSRGDVRDLLVYATDDESARAAVDECRRSFGVRAAITPVRAALVLAGARVEIMTVAARP
ncbi:MAG TPA: RidA family protein [Vicinamibacterales bacterium]